MTEQVLQEPCENFNTTVSEGKLISSDTQESSSDSSKNGLHVPQDNVVDVDDKVSSNCDTFSWKGWDYVTNIETTTKSVDDFEEPRVPDNYKPSASALLLKKRKRKKAYEAYIPVEEIIYLLKYQEPDKLRYVKGYIRINPINPQYAFLSLEDQRDLLIIGMHNRNRALEGDLVVATVNSAKHWKHLSDGTVQKTGKIVSILERVHPRTAIGVMLKQYVKNNTLIITPRDSKIPNVEISLSTINYSLCKEIACSNIFFIRIDSWERYFPSGKIIKIVGEIGEINAEMQAITLQNNLDISPYPRSFLRKLPNKNYTLTHDDVRDREDWRQVCVFTIDPATAVDIDDAVSCKVLSNGNYEIGVHIADVTHYLEFFSPLDKAVAKRATTVYMPHTAYHMLPEVLCEICSLSPGKDSLAFSVIYEMTPYGKVARYRFAKTVIRSCCKMSYETAQAMIENPGKSWPEGFLDIKGDYAPSTISDTVNRLFAVAAQLENNRFANGALRLDAPKLRAWLDNILNDDQESRIFPRFYLEEFTDSHKLIKELMLLTNETVAAHLYAAIPETALLRVHREPPEWRLQQVSSALKQIGIHLDITTAGTLNSTMDRYYPEYDPGARNNSMNSIMMAVTSMCSRAMTRAEYVCASDIPSCGFKHYALNMSFYTHFTSPIRRYVDCVVHRLLYATITNEPLPKKWSAKSCSKIAFNCNVKKQSAKLAQEQSTEVLYAYAVGLSGSFKAEAIVIWLSEDKLEVLLCDTALKFKITLEEIEGVASIDKEYSADNNAVSGLTLTWACAPPCKQIIQLFSFTTVKVEKVDKELRLQATLIQPSEE